MNTGDTGSGWQRRSWFFGFASDQLKPTFGAESIKYAFIFGLSFYVVAAILLFLASLRIKKDWVDKRLVFRRVWACCSLCLRHAR